MAIGQILNPILGWTLNYDPLIVIVLISIIINILIMLIYKFGTNQKELKAIKERLEKLQKDVKEYLRRDERKKIQKAQREMAELQLKYMKHSMRMTIYTFIPLIILFSWFNTHYLYYPLQENSTLSIEIKHLPTVDSSKLNIESADFEIESLERINENLTKLILKTPKEKGIYPLKINYENKTLAEFSLGVGVFYQEIRDKVRLKEPFKEMYISLERYHPFGESFSIFGWKPGWIGTYIIISLISSILLRKLLKVY